MFGVFSILISVLISFVSVYGFHGTYDSDKIDVLISRRSSTLAELSFPFRFGKESQRDPIYWEQCFRIYFADVLLWEKEFQVSYMPFWSEGRLVLHPPGDSSANVTIFLSYQLALMFTILNMMGALFTALAVFSYTLIEKTLKKSIFLSQFKERIGNSALFHWLFPDH